MKRASVVDVQRFIDEHPFDRFQRLIFFMCFVIVMLAPDGVGSLSH